MSVIGMNFIGIQFFRGMILVLRECDSCTGGL